MYSSIYERGHDLDAASSLNREVISVNQQAAHKYILTNGST